MRRIKEHFSDCWPMYLIGLFFTGLVSCAIKGWDMQIVNDDRLVKQCMQDGKKEYECVALMRRCEHSHYTSSPVIVLPVK